MPSEAEKPRILVVIRWPVGGIRTWCRYVYRSNEFAHYDIVIVVPDDPEAAALRQDLSDTNIKIVVVGRSDSVRSFILGVYKLILTGGWSFVHSHGFTSGLVSTIPCLIRRIPHLVTPHDVLLDWQYRDFHGRCAKSMIGLMLRSATCVQAVGRAAADNLEAVYPGIFSGKRYIRVVRNGIDTDRFLSAEPTDIRSQYNIPGDAIVVGFFGRFMAQKGFRYLVDAVVRYRESRLNNVPLVILAVGGGGFRREEELNIRESGLEDSFRFVDFSPNIAGLLKSVDVVAMPSLWEACPLQPMEALVSGVPLVVSDCSACLEVATDSPAKVVPTKNTEALLRGIMEMATPDAKKAALDYSRIAAERFDVSSTIEGMYKLYRELV